MKNLIGLITSIHEQWGIIRCHNPVRTAIGDALRSGLAARILRSGTLNGGPTLSFNPIKHALVGQYNEYGGSSGLDDFPVRR